MMFFVHNITTEWLTIIKRRNLKYEQQMGGTLKTVIEKNSLVTETLNFIMFEMKLIYT